MDYNPDNFYYCRGCHEFSYRFDCCGATICNGGGCPECKNLHEEMWRFIQFDLPEDIEDRLRGEREEYERSKYI